MTCIDSEQSLDLRQNHLSSAVFASIICILYICFPNSFSYGLWGLCQYRLRGGFRGAGSGRFRESRVREGSKVPGQVPNHVPNHGFQEVWGGSGAGSERQVPGQVPNHGFRGRFRGTGFRGRFRTTGFGAGFGGQGSAGTVPERFWPGF